MKDLMNKIKRGKHISLLSAMLLLMTFLCGLRYYINDNVFKAFNLGNLGAFGTKLEVSVLVLILMGLGYILGFGLYYLTRKHTGPRTAVTLYSVSALFAIVILLVQPFNLQLMFPGVNQQTLVMVNCIALIVFGGIETLLLSWAINVHLFDYCKNITLPDTVYLICSACLGFVTAMITLGSSFALCVAVYASVLLFVNILHSFFIDKDTYDRGVKVHRTAWIAQGGICLIAAVVMICGYFIVEPMIAIG